MTYLDSFDWRVWRDGGTAAFEEAGNVRRLVWTRNGGEQMRSVPLAAAPRFASELPPGVLRRDLEALLDVRALLPLGALRVGRLPLRVVDQAGKTVVRVFLERTVTPSDGQETGEAFFTARVQPLAGYAKAFAWVVARVRELPGVEPTDSDDLTLAATLAGRQPGDYSGRLVVPLGQGINAGGAVREVLRRLLAMIEANRPGAAADLDTEFLHEFRVAVRRTRTCLGQLRGVLPEDEVAPFAAEFRWLADATGACRDLDVFLVAIAEHAGEIGGPARSALDPAAARLRVERAAAQRAMARKLRSPRCTSLLASWRESLDREPVNASAKGARPAAEVAGAVILRAYRRLLGHAAALPAELPADAMHRLRIDAKKLRYLLEFFAGLLGEEALAPLLRELKLLQDVLGALHDAHVQRGRVVELARALAARGKPVEALLALGRLDAWLEARESEERAAFPARFAAFTAPGIRAAVERTAGGG